MSKRVDLYDLSREQLHSLVTELGEPAYRTQQIWQWLYRDYAADFDAMNNLPMDLRKRLNSSAFLSLLEPVIEQHSADGQTTKVLFELPGGNYVETVLMRYQRRRTVCISTQAGCAMGCVFCATGQMGFFRNLSQGEIVGQVLYFSRRLAAEEERVTNVVMMGMGEPFHNYDSTMAALDKLTDERGFNMGARKITISTVGLVPAIRRYADEQRQTHLAVSLHAASDEERAKLIPVAKRWPLADLMEACRYYVGRTGRRMTFEWALINSENDGVDQASRLGRLLEGMLCHVNLIPLNPTDGYGGRPSSPQRVRSFQDELARFGVSSTVRVRRGIDIQAGCGQLRERVIKESSSG